MKLVLMIIWGLVALGSAWVTKRSDIDAHGEDHGWIIFLIAAAVVTILACLPA